MEFIEANLSVWLAVFIGFATSCVSAGFLVATKRWHGVFSMDQAHGIQKFHTVPTPRIGGVALFNGALALWLALPIDTKVGADTHHLLGWVLLGAVPAFGAGLIEDITKKVSVKMRLFATACSGLTFSLLSGLWINKVGMPGLDFLLAFAPFGILFTAFAVSGIANSVNIIDGFNGLASGVVVLMLLTLAVIAFRVDDAVVFYLALSGVAVVLGFMLLNFPKGLIFLGDAGAYSLGYFVAVLAVALTLRNPGNVSPWAMLLVCGYPIIETMFSIYRRVSRKVRRNPGTPDASHLHSLVYRRVVSRKLIPYAPAWKRNAMTSPFMWLYSLVPMFGAIFWPQSLGMVIAWLAFSFFVYLKFYRRMVSLSIFFRKQAIV